MGLVAERCALSGARLAGPEYRPDAIFTADQAGWPGDWEGRTVLGQCLIARATGQPSPYLAANLAALETQVNARGYLGEILPNGLIREQQLSGHSWLLRGLCEAWEADGDPRTLARIRGIVENLFLPAADAYAEYPLDKSGHLAEGAAAGTTAARVGRWLISTDTGCAFIPLDGLSHAYRVLRDPALARLLEAMIRRFLQLDLVGLQVQTHATLTACRGLLRYGEDAGRPDLFAEVRRIFDLYLAEGMTAHYANCNWFGRPTWTEPCAVIDSYMLAQQLYAVTEERRYLELARRIAFNGFLAGQRKNGGFGTDTCPGAGSGNRLGMSLWEAVWCCTMRGGEGLACLARYNLLVDGPRVRIAQLTGCRVRDGAMAFTLESRYPLAGELDLTVEAFPEDGALELALPAWAEDITVNGAAAPLRDGLLTLRPRPGEHYTVTFPCPLREETAPGRNNGRARLRMRGDLILGKHGDAWRPLLERAGMTQEALEKGLLLWEEA